MDSDRALETDSHHCSPDAMELERDPDVVSVSGKDEEDNTQLEKKNEHIDSDANQGCPTNENENNLVCEKILKLTSLVEDLKKEHSEIVGEIKNMTTELVIDPKVYTNLQILGVNHEQTKNKCTLLEKKYIQESTERKRLYNEVIELKGNIRVFCRCRPLHASEVENGSTTVIEYDSGLENELQVTCSDSSKKQFKFDHVFKPDDSQETVFSQTSHVVTSVMDGYNVCIFAYGQTGTGKTFTMEGTPENRGVNYRTLEELFRLSKERHGTMAYELYVSMLEVYNEKIRDLLVENSTEPTKKLEVKQTPEGTQDVPGLTEARVYSTDEVWELLNTGSRARSVGSTNANELSSRSHCLLRVTVKGDLVNGQRAKSHLWLVDLAGSERLGKIEVEGERLKESQFINKSLSALGDVISALAAKTPHVPYRNSKLTHLLQSSLGGDCKTLMFVQVSPSVADLGETLCSLNFASRVRGIEAGPARKQADTNELYKYKQLAEKQKQDEKELKKLQDGVKSLQLRLAAREHICRGLQDKVKELESQLAEERKLRLKQETKAFAAASAPSSTASFRKHVQPVATEKRPPVAPTKMRMPLRKISNCMPPPSPLPPPYRNNSRPSMVPSYNNDKENMHKMANAARGLMQPRRRVSMAVRPSPQAFQPAQVIKPKRRVSVATFQPDQSGYSYLTTPMHSRNSHMRNYGGGSNRHPLLLPPQKASYLKLFSPLPELRLTGMMTPAPVKSNSKFMGSPPTQIGSWKPKHPTVVALQKKTLVWSPLKHMKTFRKASMLPVRSTSSELQ